MDNVWCLFYLDETSKYLLYGIFANKEKAEAQKERAEKTKQGRDCYRVESWAVLDGE